MPFGIIAAAIIIATRLTPQPHLVVNIPDLPAPIVTVTMPAPVTNLTIPEQPAPVVNVTVPKTEPVTVVVEPAPVPPPEVVYRDRTVEVERTIEVPSCLDYGNLPHFDLANALSRAFPGAQWSLNGSHYPGLVWLDASPKPDMAAIIGGWLTWLSSAC
jgi:hypothetical protein